MNIFRWLKNKIVKHKHMIIPMLIVLILPNLVGILIGYEYSNYPCKNADTIIVNHDESATAVALVKMIKENETFNVIKESTENSDVEKYIKEGKAAAGIIIPEDFSYNITHGKEAKIMVFNDGALSSSGSTVRSKISETLGTIKAGYMIKIAEGTFNMAPQTAKYVVSPFGYKTRILGNPTSNIANMMVEGVLLTMCQMLFMGQTAFIREKKRFKNILAKVLVCAFWGFISACITVVVQTRMFNTPYNGSVLAGVLLIALASLGFSFLGMAIRIGAKHGVDDVVSKVSLVSFTMLLSGYTFPVFAMPKFFSYLEYWMPNRHIIIPLRSIGLLGCNLNDIKGDIIWLIAFVCLMFLFMCYKFYLKPVLEQKKKAKKALKSKAETSIEMAGEQ